MSAWYLGTVGFSYKEWDGVFYPAGTPGRLYLAIYSQIFNSVELDSTFYGTPPPDRVKQWANAVPSGFKFCVKTPRQITHDLRLLNVQEPMAQFLRNISLFGDKLGAVLIQLPPSLSTADLDLFNRFMVQLPPDFRYAIEFRHPSWFNDLTADLLAAHDLGWVSTEYVDMPRQVVPTTDFLYIRWLGRHGAFKTKDHEQVDKLPQLRWWQSQIEPYLSRFKTVYGYFNNDYSGYSPQTCNRFKEMLGLPVIQPELPEQKRLF